MATIVSLGFQLFILGLTLLTIAVLIPLTAGMGVVAVSACLPGWKFMPLYTQRRRIVSRVLGFLAFALVIGFYTWLAANVTYWIFMDEHGVYPGQPTHLEHDLDRFTLGVFRQNDDLIKTELQLQTLLPPGVKVCFSAQHEVCQMANRVSTHVAQGSLGWLLYLAMLAGGAVAGLTTNQLLQENPFYRQRPLSERVDLRARRLPDHFKIPLLD